MPAYLRLLISALIAFCFYGAWAFYANQSQAVTNTVLYQIALVQASTSAAITLGFTMLTEWSYRRFGQRCVSFAFVTPLLCLPYHNTPYAKQFKRSFNQLLDNSAGYLHANRFSGALFAPLVPMVLQGTIVIGVNVVNATPNLWLTVIPSIFFSGLYGYVYTFSLYKKDQVT